MSNIAGLPDAAVLSDGDASGEQRPPTHTRLRQHTAPVMIAAAAAIVIAQRLVVMVRSPKPIIFGDEAGSWAIAQYLAGEPSIQMFGNPPYSVLSGSLLAPIVAVFDTAPDQYRAFLVLSIVCTLGAAALAAVLGRRLLGLSPTGTAVAFTMAALYPATLFSSSFSWAEFLTPLWFVGVCWLVVRAVMLMRGRDWVGAALWAGSATAMHGRFSAVPLVLFGLCAVVALAPAAAQPVRFTLRHAALTAGAFGVSFLCWRLLSHAAYEHVWSDPSNAERTRWLSRLDEWRFWWAVAMYTVGHLWYAVTSSFGLAVLGAIALIRRAVAPSSRQTRLAAAAVMALCASVFASSVLVNAGNSPRHGPTASLPEFLYYGRYADPATLLLAACGAGFLVVSPPRTFRRTAVIAGATLGLTGAITWWTTSRSLSGPTFGPRVPGVWLLPFDAFNTVSVPTATLVSAVVLGTLAVAARFRLDVAALAAALAVGAIFATSSALELRREYQFSPLYEPVIDSAIPAGDVVVASDVARSAYRSLALLVQEYHLVPLGWRFEMADATSDELVADLPDGAQLIVLRGDIDPGEFADGQVLTWAVGLWILRG